MHGKLMRPAGALALAAVALSGCWYQGGANAANTRHNAGETRLTRTNVASLAEGWRVPLDAVVTEPVVAGQRVYLATRAEPDDIEGGRVGLGVQALDRTTGDVVWEHRLDPEGTAPASGGVSTPVLADGVLSVPFWHDELGSCAGAVVRLDAATGEVVGTTATGTGGSDLVSSGTVVAHMDAPSCGNGRLVVRDRSTGAVRWAHTFAEGSTVATPTIADGRVYVLRRGTLHAFALDGCGAPTCEPLWSRAGVSRDEWLRPSAGPDGSVVLIGISDDEVGASVVEVRDGATGAQRWEAPARYSGGLPGMLTGVAISDDTLYVAGARRDADTGADTAVLDAYPLGGCAQAACPPAWSVDLGPTTPSAEPTVAGGVVYVPLRASNESAPAVAALDAAGCGAPSCDEMSRVDLVDGHVGLFGPGASSTAVGSGRLLAVFLPGLYGTTTSEVVSFGPAG